MLDPQTIFEFNQKFKELQIHAGMGVTEDNVMKIGVMCGQLSDIAGKLMWEANPKEQAQIAEEVEEIKTNIQKEPTLEVKESNKALNQ